jgi:hypothetical protein
MRLLNSERERGELCFLSDDPNEVGSKGKPFYLVWGDLNFCQASLQGGWDGRIVAVIRY